MSPGEEHYVDESARLALPRAASASIAYLGIGLTLRDRPAAVAVLVACVACHVAALIWFGRNNRTGSINFTVRRTLAYLLPELVCGVVAGWPEPTAFFLLLNALTRDEVNDLWARYAFAVSLLAIVAAVLLVGGPLHEHVVLIIAAIVAHVAMEKRMSMTRRLLDTLAQRNVDLLAAQEELSRLHAQAIASEKLSGLGLLAAGVAHEINNPMSYIGSNINSLLRDLRQHSVVEPWLAEYRDEVLPETLDGIQRVNAIVSDLRLFARGDPKAMVAYDINEAVERALRIATGSLHQACKAQLDLAPVPSAVGFPGQIIQVLLNLIINGVDAHKPGQINSLIVSTRLIDDHAVIAVTDQGGGIPPEVRARLFEPFMTTKPVGKGTGLGLAVAYGIVKTHRGRIEVETELGKGTTFSVWLPLQPGLARMREAEAPLAT
jgi:signal transduction histidine kinase